MDHINVFCRAVILQSSSTKRFACSYQECRHRSASEILHFMGLQCGIVYSSSWRDNGLSLNTFSRRLKTHLFGQLCGQQAPLWLYVDNIRHRCGVMWTTSGTVVAFLAPSTNVLMHLHTSCSHALHSDQPAFIDIFGLLCNFVITFIEQRD